MEAHERQLIQNDDVEALWTCAEHDIEVFLPPTFYADAGTPMCSECGEDMEYWGTWIRTTALDRV